MPPDRVRVDFRKYPDTQHWQYDLRWLAEDDHGTWLWGPAGTRAQRSDEPPITFKSTNLKLVTDDWWAGIWQETGEPEVYVDICTPAVWSEGRATMVDLDLDVARLRSGAVRVLDEDEFAEHQVALAYPPELIEGALDACERVRGMIERNEEPFATIAAGRLAEAVALGREASSESWPGT